ncbi:hypothetical protein JCM6882_009065 [Rhodosporidiobolus microsporus]
MSSAIRLPQEPSPLAQSFARLKRVRGVRDLWRWSFKSFRLAGLPLRIRPAFILYTFLTLLVLSLLGFHPTLAHHLAPPDVPFSDKLLHFVCFWAATMLFYRIWVVEEHARRVWSWAWFNELVSIGVCVLTGGILSEVVQSLLPYKTFQPGDILANLLGSSLGVFVSSKLAARQRRDAELRRLYSHLGELSDSDDEGDDEDAAERGVYAALSGAAGAAGGATAEEREMEEGRVRAEDKLRRQGSGEAIGRARRGRHDPWNASMGENEIFGLGGEEDDEDVNGGDGRGQGTRKGPL